MKTVRMFLTVLLLATATFAQAPGGQAAPNPNDPVQQARKLSQEGKYEEAVALLSKEIATNPKNYDAHLALGVTLDLDGKYVEARKHIQHAIDLAKPEQKAQAERTMAMSWAFERKAAQAAKYEEPIFNARLEKGDLTGAGEIANELARVYLESGDIDNAYVWYKRGYDTAIKQKDLTPEQLALWQFRWEHAQARIAARRNQKEEAQSHVAAAKAALDKTGDKDQQIFFPYLTGYVAFYLGEYKTAITDLEQANQRDPFILAMLAQAYENTGEKQKADELYRKIMTINAHNPTGAYARPLARRKLGMS